jgi:FixJ family two-component response regulator
MSKYRELFRTMAGGGLPVPAPEEGLETDLSGREQGFTLLFVDDEEGVLHSLRRIFMEENYEILTALSADQALAVMEKVRVHLVVTDHRMPGMTGAELLKSIKERWPETIRIMLTGYADVQSIMGAVKDGAVYKFITKPWNDEDLRLTVSLALQQYVLMQENHKLKEITRKQQLKIKNFAGLFEEKRGVLGNIMVKAGVLSKEELEQAHHGADGVEIARLGISDFRALLRDHDRRAVGGHGALDGAHRSRTPDEQRNGHVREDDDVSQREARKLRGERERLVGAHDLITRDSERPFRRLDAGRTAALTGSLGNGVFAHAFLDAGRRRMATLPSCAVRARPDR